MLTAADPSTERILFVRYRRDTFQNSRLREYRSRRRRERKQRGTDKWSKRRPRGAFKNRASAGSTNRKISYRPNTPVNHRRVNAAHTFSDSCLVPLPRQLLVSASAIFFLLIFHGFILPRPSEPSPLATLADYSVGILRLLREKSLRVVRALSLPYLGNKTDMIAC